MPATTLKEFLDRHEVPYVSIRHAPAYTAQETAALAHIPGREIAKTVMVKVDGQLAMAVLPASEHVDMRKLRAAMGAEIVELATETEFLDRFPDCEPGAMPPFGNLYDLHVYAADDLAEEEEIAFNAGTHTELIRMPYRDFQRLVGPTVITFAAPTTA
ncbi:MAG TPA: YbaK/EbsC family protein [Gemmatimonadales bacterium]|jgi:Ala-tRNA(Pro) deacylase